MATQARDEGRPSRWWHVWGAVILLWGVGAWVEWFLVPALLPDRAGPVPYADFALLPAAIACGCMILGPMALLIPIRRPWRLLYAAAPLAYLGYHLWRII
jgi:hypothetical protein